MATVASSGPDPRPRARARGVRFKLIAVLAVAVLLFAVYCYVVLHWSYSSGEQAGWVQMLSYKGWVCKTWEGELAVVTMPGTAPEKFRFTIWDDKVAADVNRLNGHRVALRYEEKVGIPSRCFGDTRYYVTGVRQVEEVPIVPPGAIPGAPPPGEPAGAPAAAGSSIAPAAPSAPAQPSGIATPDAGGQAPPRGPQQ